MSIKNYNKLPLPGGFRGAPINKLSVGGSSPEGGSGDRGFRTISLIIVHCSATEAGKDYGVEDITRWHKAQGFKTCGYHYVVRLDGTIEEGRPESMVGAHCKNHNKHSIGVCYVGGLAPSPRDRPTGDSACDTRTPAQKKSLIKLLTELHERYPRAIILGHRDLSPDLDGNGLITPNEYLKQCPCFDAMLEYDYLQPEGFFR